MPSFFALKWAIIDSPVALWVYAIPKLRSMAETIIPYRPQSTVA